MLGPVSLGVEFGVKLICSDVFACLALVLLASVISPIETLALFDNPFSLRILETSPVADRCFSNADGGKYSDSK